MNTIRNDTQHSHDLSRIAGVAAPRLGAGLQRALQGLTALALSLTLGGVGHVPVAAQSTVMEVTNACDALITPETLPAGVTTIKLMGPPLHECAPTFNPATGELLTGNGISIEVDNVTLDLNGRSIRSTSDVAAAGEALVPPVDVENAGVSVGGKNVTVTNTSTTVSRVHNFTANFDVKAQDSRLVGMRLADGSYNLVGGDAHGGGALAIDKSKRVTVDTVMLKDMGANGDNGIDLKRSENVTIKNSRIEGILTGVRIRNTNGVTLTNNAITGGCEALELAATALNVTQTGNTLAEGAACPGKPAG